MDSQFGTMPPANSSAGVLSYDFKHNGERLLHLLRQQHPDYHPIVSIAKIAHSAEEENDLETALRAHSTVLKYVEPELKAVEVNIKDDRKRTINVSLFEDAVDITDESVKEVSDQSDRALSLTSQEERDKLSAVREIIDAELLT